MVVKHGNSKRAEIIKAGKSYVIFGNSAFGNSNQVSTSATSTLDNQSSNQPVDTVVINDDLLNDSLINPADNSTGTLIVNGDYTQTANGILQIEIGGTDIGNFDQLEIDDLADLKGTLNISLVNSYTPQLGDSFEIMTFGSLLGDFTTSNFPNLPNNLSWQTQFDANSLTLAIG